MVRVKPPRHHSSISNRAFVLVLENQSKLALGHSSEVGSLPYLSVPTINPPH
jgi:hypothetical protein